VLFVLFGLCLIAALVFVLLAYNRGKAEIDQIVREQKALNDRRLNG
jgi:hypothetical protein